MVVRKFTVVLEAAEEGGYIATCLELPVASQGETREEALNNIKEAIEGYLEGELPLPKGRGFPIHRYTYFHMWNTREVFQHATRRGVFILGRLPYVP